MRVQPGKVSRAQRDSCLLANPGRWAAGWGGSTSGGGNTPRPVDTLQAMASTHRLLRALADRPEELALLLRCEYRPKQTLLQHAVAVGNADLLDTLLGFDPSLARFGSSRSGSEGWIDLPPDTALADAIMALQPAAVRTLLPHSWPSGCHSSSAAGKQQASGGQISPASSAEDGSWSPGAFQASMLSLLLRVLAVYDGWPLADRLWLWPKPAQPPPADWRPRVEATLAALLEGPHGGWVRRCHVGSLLHVVFSAMPLCLLCSWRCPQMCYIPTLSMLHLCTPPCRHGHQPAR